MRKRLRLEISCVTKTGGYSQGKNILFVGGLYPGKAVRFKFSEKEAIDLIEQNKYEFFITRNGKVFDIIVSETIDGKKFLKSLIDLDFPSVLLNLPECP